MLTDITHLLLKEPDYKKRGAVFQYCYEDMEIMTDAELQAFVAGYKSTTKFLLDPAMYFDAGKVATLLRLLEQFVAEGRKILVFSQVRLFVLHLGMAGANVRVVRPGAQHPRPGVRPQAVQVLDADWHYACGHPSSSCRRVLRGRVDSRVPSVHEGRRHGHQPDRCQRCHHVRVAHSTVASHRSLTIHRRFDQDFNPHNDRQAQDRAYRIGQKRDVDVIKLVTRGTIEEDMLRLGQTKLALDEAVAGDSEETGAESEAAKQMRTSLMKTLRDHFQEEEPSQDDVAKKADDVMEID
jgi:SWI/SNF-related matrix-associated actin-dependent regulator 1 of chromatin subfamily A